MKPENEQKPRQSRAVTALLLCVFLLVSWLPHSHPDGHGGGHSCPVCHAANLPAESAPPPATPSPLLRQDWEAPPAAPLMAGVCLWTPSAGRAPPSLLVSAL